MKVSIMLDQNTGYRLYKTTCEYGDQINLKTFVAACIKLQVARATRDVSEYAADPRWRSLLESKVRNLVHARLVYTFDGCINMPHPESTFLHEPQHIKQLLACDGNAIAAVVSLVRTEESTTALLMGFRLAMDLFIESTLYGTTHKPLPYRVRNTLRCDIMEIEVIQTISHGILNSLANKREPHVIVDVDSSATQKRKYIAMELVGSVSVDCENSQDSVVADVDIKREEEEVPLASVLGIQLQQESALLAAIPPTFSSSIEDAESDRQRNSRFESAPISRSFVTPVYIFAVERHVCEELRSTPISVFRFESEMRTTCRTYSRLFSDWKAMLHGFNGPVGPHQFHACSDYSKLFGQNCIKTAQHDADQRVIFGSEAQALWTSRSVLHSMAQAAAVLINRQYDYGMRNWLMTCWAVHTRIRLEYLLHAKSFDYVAHSEYLHALGIANVPEADQWTEIDAQKLAPNQQQIVLGNVLRWNNLAWPQGFGEQTSLERKIAFLLETGTRNISACVQAYCVGFSQLAQRDDAALLAKYLAESYREAFAAYGGSCCAASYSFRNAYINFSHSRNQRKKVRASLRDLHAGSDHFKPRMELPKAYDKDDFGFSVYDPCDEEKDDPLESCICGIADIKWSNAFSSAVGFDPPVGRAM